MVCGQPLRYRYVHEVIAERVAIVGRGTPTVMTEMLLSHQMPTARVGISGDSPTGGSLGRLAREMEVPGVGGPRTVRGALPGLTPVAAGRVRSGRARPRAPVARGD